jgi:hypothetical protein
MSALQEHPVIPKPSVSEIPAEIEEMTHAAATEMPEIGDARYLGVVRGKQFTTPQFTKHYKDFYSSKTQIKNIVEINFKQAPHMWAEQYIEEYGISPYIDFEGDFEKGFKDYIISKLTDATDKNYLSILNGLSITANDAKEIVPITKKDVPPRELTTLLDKLYYLRGEYLAKKVPLAPANPARAQANARAQQAQANARAQQAQANARAQQAQANARAQQATVTAQAAAEHYEILLDLIPYIDDNGKKKEVSYDQTQDIMTRLKQEVTEIYDKFDDLFIKFSLNNSLTGETKQVFDDVIGKMKDLAKPPVDGDDATVKAEKELKFGNYLSIMRQVKSFYPELYDKVETAMKPTLPRLSVAIPNKNNVGNPNAATPNSKWSPGSQTLGSPNTPGFRQGSALPSPLQSPGSPQQPPKGGKGSKKISSRFKPQIV